MALVRSLVYSLLATVLATMAARQALSVSQPPGGEGRPHRSHLPVVILVPILVGNSNNRIGYVKEVHHHHRPLIGRVRT